MSILQEKQKRLLRFTYDKCFESQDIATYVGYSWGRRHHLVIYHI